MSEGPASPSSQAQPAELSSRQILGIVSGLMLGIFLVAIDQTVTTTSIRVIADDFGGYSQQAWVTSTYLIASTLVMLLYGKLSDIFGRKPTYLFAISVFMIGSLACTAATSMPELAAFRAVQGLGAGGLSVLAFAIVGEIVAPQQRARYTGYILGVFTIAGIIGPLIGGFFASQDVIAGIAGWRWSFLINVPIGVVALVIVTRALNLPNKHRAGVRIDWLGSVFLTVAVVPLLVVTQFGQQWGWGSVGSVLCFVIFAVGVLAFLLVEKRMGENALLPLRIFRNTQFSQGTAIAFIFGVFLLGVFTLVAQYFQVVLNASPTQAGIMLLPGIFGSLFGTLASGQFISRTGRYRAFSISSAVLTVLSLVLLYVLSAHPSLPALLPVVFVFGLGLGGASQPVTLVMQSILPITEMGVSTASVTFFRQIGGAIGLPVLLALWFAFVSGDIANSVNSQAAGEVVHDTSVIQKLPPAVADTVRQAFADSMSSVFLVSAVLAVVVLVLLVLWKPVELRTMPGAPKAAKAGKAGKEGAPATT